MKMSIRIPKSALERWAKMEDENQHGRRLFSIADFFYKSISFDETTRLEEDEQGGGDFYAPIEDFFEVRQLLFTINSVHEASERGLSAFMYNVRTACRVQLRACIRDYFGDDVLNKVNP